MTDIKIAIIGLGYVGLPLAIEFGKIYQTIGFDINSNRVKELNSGKDSTLEVEDEVLKSSFIPRFIKHVKLLIFIGQHP